MKKITKIKLGVFSVVFVILGLLFGFRLSLFGWWALALLFVYLGSFFEE